MPEKKKQVLLSDMDTRVKVALCILIAAFLIASDSPAVTLTSVAIVITLIFLTPGPVTAAIRPVLMISPLLCIIVIVHAFSGPESVEPGLDSLAFNRYGLFKGSIIATELGLLVACGSVLSRTTSPSRFQEAAEWFAYPGGLRKRQKFGLASRLVLRFISLAERQFSRVRRAQQGRGIPVRGGGLRMRLRAQAAIIVPVLVSMFRAADKTAEALVIRGFDPSRKRSRMEKSRPGVIDLIIMSSVLTALSFAWLSF